VRLLSPGTQVNIPAVTSGRGLENPGDILLDPYFLKSHGLEIGGHMELNGKTFNIVGSVAVPNYVYVIKNLYDVLPTSGFGIGIVSGADFKAFPEAVTVYAAYFEDRENINAQAAKLHGLLSAQGYRIPLFIL
jgi:putative ABC transport system permease protein